MDFSLPTGAETSRPAAIGHQELLPALGAAHAGKALLEITTFQELAHDRADNGPPEALAFLIALCIDRLKLRIKPLDQLIEGSLLGVGGDDTRCRPHRAHSP